MDKCEDCVMAVDISMCRTQISVFREKTIEDIQHDHPGLLEFDFCPKCGNPVEWGEWRINKCREKINK